jgi:cyclase
VDRIAKEIDIPFTVGGGIQSLQDAREIISAGADKVSINSAAVRNPAIITEIAGSFGSQAVVVAIDARLQNNTWEVVINGGRVSTGISVKDWMLEVQKQGAGEILLTSMNHDGVKHGFALDLINQLQPYTKVPLIASGGAGAAAHFSDLFLQTPASAGLAASIFHFGEITIPSLKKYLANQNIPIR